MVYTLEIISLADFRHLGLLCPSKQTSFMDAPNLTTYFGTSILLYVLHISEANSFVKSYFRAPASSKDRLRILNSFRNKFTSKLWVQDIGNPQDALIQTMVTDVENFLLRIQCHLGIYFFEPMSRTNISFHQKNISKENRTFP